ncbi:nicotinate-nucleotide--dimethylbenzimidazole phosphoribosyltransferase [Lentisphaera profundi]|uniref:Nicotinate-nucleotide--dimethylbenzimidazole phosphoribosyltransferase n=1 Tax=Lentisphaera profundi TaxID=1658616 RepID=A0ABY7VTP0_9BACT|nr:nicotinate-nucleotide--dimethylbenzimidazole phosphoribosyltransferase [Lentisphaera profundi]WDE97129.1 nicotinate-nucleotide--dimethylbenzimidazole phosphoribosyltransferase [Lentisphaera profundi]
MFKSLEIRPLNQSFANAAKQRLDELAIPLGALGDLGDLAVKLMISQKSLTPTFKNRELYLCAADHGIASQGVSKYPQITDKILACASHSGAVINALCETHNCTLSLFDCGLINEPKTGSVKIFTRVIAQGGTKDFSIEPAMSSEQCLKALENGIELGKTSSSDLILLGEMGIGNTSSASAIYAKLEGLQAIDCVGAGTGLDDEGIQHKAKLIQQGLGRFSIDELAEPAAAFEVLRQVGGFELATLVGISLGAASCGKLILLDGFLSAVVALLAKSFNAHVLDYMIASHRSHEKAHEELLKLLNKKPLLDLNMRLGEGSGAVLALPLIDSVCSILENTMTLNEALDV